jgi:hypothetical protein
VGPGLRLGDVDVAQHLGAAVLLEDDRLHADSAFPRYSKLST